jgi:putative transposase
MQQPTVRKTLQYKLQPTPQQAAVLEQMLLLCRRLYNCALEQRRTWWGRGQGRAATHAQQEAELPDRKATFPEYTAIQSPVLHDVLTRLDRAFPACFRRVQTGEVPGYPRFQGAQRYHSFTSKQFGNGATLDNGFLVLSKIGRLAVRWSRPLVGTPKTVTLSREADGWYVAFSCAEVPTQPLPETGRETGIDVGLKVFLVAADGGVMEHPRHSTAAAKSGWPRRRAASRAARRGATGARRRCNCWPKRTSTCVGNAAITTTRRRWRCSETTTRSLSKICRSAIWYGITTWPRASVLPAGQHSVLSSKPKQYTLGGG